MTTIHAAGYIVCNNEAIWGYGKTENEAWNSFLAEMKHGGVEVVTEPTEAQLDNGGNWTRESDYRIRAASAALLAAVYQQGGDIPWYICNGVCCTGVEAWGG